MEIRCKKTDCAYNTGASCSAESIMVGGYADCETYSPDELKKSLIIKNGNLFEISEELVAKNTRNVPLSCRAKHCLFNRQSKCYANGITVIDDEDDAGCATFIER
ncbi:MAG: DUF1540 domain-containing protein [Firmicutes bacterium]|nr:DUF1540 domain-containing protein [Bacillota bacterium]